MDRFCAMGEVQSSGCWLTTQGCINLIEMRATMRGPREYATLPTRLDRRQQIRCHVLQRLIDRLRRLDGHLSSPAWRDDRRQEANPLVDGVGIHRSRPDASTLPLLQDGKPLMVPKS